MDHPVEALVSVKRLAMNFVVLVSLMIRLTKKLKMLHLSILNSKIKILNSKI